MKAEKAAPTFLLLAVAQLLLYAAFMNREVAWNYILHGDPTWYVYFNYKIYHAVVERNWAVIWQQATTSPWGILLFLETLVPQFLLGPSRFSVGVINLVYFLLAQAAVYIFFARLTCSVIGGVTAVALLMAMQTPFRGDGPGLNIADFHFDLVLFFLLVILHLMVAWSNSFARRWASIAIGLFAGLTVATRLVSFYLLGGVFGVFGLVMLYKWLRSDAKDNDLSRDRLRNFRIALWVYVVTSLIPLTIAAKALYAHYFRFVFDAKYSADRAGLYVMGATSKLGEAYEVMVRMLKFDFGHGYLAVLLIAVTVVWVGSRNMGLPVKVSASHDELAKASGWIGRMLADREAMRTYWLFLLISGVTSYVMHIVFPIKSDHLTRMTAAPILIAVMLLISPMLVRQWNESIVWRRTISRVAVGLLVTVALFVQLAFYTGPGRFHDMKAEVSEIQNLYADIGRLAGNRGQKEIAISVDRITHFELGALLGFAIYDFEQNSRFLIHEPKLGGVIDEPIELEQAKMLLGQSDFALLGSMPYPESSLPFMKSLRPISEDVHKYVEQHFCLYKGYMLFGEPRRLYVNQNKRAWQYSASASTEPGYGPDGLLEGRSRIWHAPWAENRNQWVEFQRENPLQFSALTIVAQDGAPERAPRNFILEALDSQRGWSSVLSVKDADFSINKSLTWPITSDRAYSRYRLVVTRNNGDPNLMTIQDMKLDIGPDQKKCAGPAQSAVPGRSSLSN